MAEIPITTVSSKVSPSPDELAQHLARIAHDAANPPPLHIAKVNSFPKIVVLDFDGILAVPWTNPVQLFPQVPAILRELKNKGYTLMMASFNPAAIRELRRFGLLDLFSAVRAGTIDNRELTDFQHDLGKLSKAKQIQSMYEELRLSDGPMIGREVFFDDDPENYAEVMLAFYPEFVGPERIDSFHGLTNALVNEWFSH